jgi:hypothetical protein
MIEMNDEYMSLVIDDKLVATARFSRHAAADGDDAWIVSTTPPDCSAATRPSRHWRWLNASRLATATTTRS